MPSYIRPARVDITEGGIGIGGLILIAAAVAAVGVVVVFIAARILLLAVCAAVFVAGIGGFLAWTRWAASPQRLRAHYYSRPVVRVIPARPAAPISAPQRKVIEPGRTIPAQVHLRDVSHRKTT